MTTIYTIQVDGRDIARTVGTYPWTWVADCVAQDMCVSPNDVSIYNGDNDQFVGRDMITVGGRIVGELVWSIT